MAMTLVDGMTEKWDPSQFHNTFKEDVLALVQKKIKANQSKTISEPEPDTAPARRDNVVDLMALLKQSIHTKTKTEKVAPDHRAAEKTRKSAARTRKSSKNEKTTRKTASAASKTTRTKSSASSTRTTAPREKRASK